MAPASPSPFATLSDEITLLNSLIGLMKQEQAFLVSADTDGLNSLMQQKTLWIDDMGKLAARRHQQLAAAGFEAADSGMPAALAGARDGAAAAHWQQLLDLAREAKELNRLNGMLINKQMSHNQGLIDAMRVPAGAADTGFYGPSGQATVATGTRKLVVG